ncbi:hypothetical protein AX16_004879 [Volvariella volvacea WC 439]|nr:hypothetical protein AX16_004879 [Volvariella volvacea WC 439]
MVEEIGSWGWKLSRRVNVRRASYEYRALEGGADYDTTRSKSPPLSSRRGVPADYEVFREYERRIMENRYGDGVGERYLRFPEHLWGHGFNNVLQETFLMSYLAYLTNRSYVFEEYTWSRSSPFYWTIDEGSKLRPSRIPLTAFLSGYIVGRPISSISAANLSIQDTTMPSPQGSPSLSADSTPRSRHSVRDYPTPGPLSVNVDLWRRVCSNEDVVVVSSEDMPEEPVDGQALVEWWVEKLTRGDIARAKCVQVDGIERRKRAEPIFDKHLFGSPRIHSLLPGLLSSPIITHFGWSPLINMVLSKNWDLLKPELGISNSTQAISAAPKERRPPPLSTQPTVGPPSPPSRNTTQPVLRFPGMLAVHLRRGDYGRHCPRLASWGSMYMGVNRLPSLADRFEPWRAFSHQDDGLDESGLGFAGNVQGQGQGQSQGQSLVGDSSSSPTRLQEQDAWLGWWSWDWLWSWFGSRSGSAEARGNAISSVLRDRDFSDLDMENWFFEDALAGDRNRTGVSAFERGDGAKRSLHSFRPRATTSSSQNREQRTQVPPVELLEYYTRHCFPSISEIRQRLKGVREESLAHSRSGHAGRVDGIEHDALRRVYILTNGSGRDPRTKELKEGLLEDGWEEVVVGGDLDSDVRGELTLNAYAGGDDGAYRESQSERVRGHDDHEALMVGKKEVEGVMIAVDMAIAQGADVFVGNGFSSATANIVLLRLANGKDMSTNRFL